MYTHTHIDTRPISFRKKKKKKVDEIQETKENTKRGRQAR